MSYKLFLDDVRDPNECVKYMHKRIGNQNTIYLEDDWVIAKDYNEFVKTIKENGWPDVVSFDHDLADEHYDIGKMDDETEYNALYNGFEEKTGYDAVIWLCGYHEEDLEPFPQCFIHTQNPVGYQNIKSYIENYLKQL